MAVNSLTCIKNYWSTDQFMGSQAIQNLIASTRFKAILQNLHFTNNQKKDDSDKRFKVGAVIKHFH